MVSIFFSFPLFPRLFHLLFLLQASLTHQSALRYLLYNLLLNTVCKSPVAHSVCFFLHHFLKSASSFNIASKHTSSKVFSSWTLAGDTSGIHIFPENNKHPTVSASSSLCPCNFSSTLHGCLDSLHSHFLLPVLLRWKSLLFFSFPGFPCCQWYTSWWDWIIMPLWAWHTAGLRSVLQGVE